MRMTKRWNRVVYRLWVPVYDATVSHLFVPGRRRAIQLLALQPGERVPLVGVGTGADLPLLPAHLVDGYVQVADEDAMAAARRLAAEEGIFAGFSSGANVAGAMRLLKGPCRGKSVVVLMCDSGLKYLSTDLWGLSSGSA